MHMADALISPVVGGAMWTASIGTMGYSIKKLQLETDYKKIPLMGVMGAFVFAAQMVNFSIPFTGSSGHIGGGILLAILLGPYAGFLTLASVLIIQALFFADGGLLALGSNIINLGFFTCFVAYPLIYKPFVKNGFTKKRLFLGSTIASVVGLQLGAVGVVLETSLSGITALPLSSFFILMQPIHLAIGIVEGLISAAIVLYIHAERPDIIENTTYERNNKKNEPIKRVAIVLVVATLLIGGFISLFASENPDGLEWAIFQTTGGEEIQSPEGVYEVFTNIQEQTAVLPDYNLKYVEETPLNINGTSLSGLVGGLLTLLFIGILGLIIRLLKFRKNIT